jgi:hypothetical protein
MTTLRFKGSGVPAIVRHMTEATDWDQGWAERSVKRGRPKPRPQLVFVHDDGLYILSNGKPAQMAGEGKRFVVYATGYDPRAAGVWEKARNAVGGDDQAGTPVHAGRTQPRPRVDPEHRPTRVLHSGSQLVRKRQQSIHRALLGNVRSAPTSACRATAGKGIARMGRHTRD